MGEGGLHSIEDDEIGFVLHDGVSPAPGHFGDTVGAAGEDGEECEDERYSEEAEFDIFDDCCGRRAHLSASRVEADKVVADEDCKDKQGEHLPHDTSHHQVISEILVGLGVRRRSDTSAGSLEHERQQIAADEDPGVPFCADARGLGAEGEDHVFEGEVDAGGEEGRGDDEAADLDVEADAIIGVAVEHYSADVAWAWSVGVGETGELVLDIPSASPRHPMLNATIKDHDLKIIP